MTEPSYRGDAFNTLAYFVSAPTVSGIYRFTWRPRWSLQAAGIFSTAINYAMAPKVNNKAALKEAKRRKQQQKSAAKEKKRSEQEEVDIDVILKELEQEERRQRSIKAQIIPSDQPSPRAHATLTVLPR